MSWAETVRSDCQPPAVPSPEPRRPGTSPKRRTTAVAKSDWNQRRIGMFTSKMFILRASVGLGLNLTGEEIHEIVSLAGLSMGVGAILGLLDAHAPFTGLLIGVIVFGVAWALAAFEWTYKH